MLQAAINQVPEFYVVPQCKVFLWIPTVALCIQFLMDIFLDANTPKYEAIRFDHEDENFACQHHFSPHSLLTLLLPFIGSDKPFESARSARVLR